MKSLFTLKPHHSPPQKDWYWLLDTGAQYLHIRRRVEQPVEDFPLMVALHCDVLMICSCNNMRDTKARNTLLADIEYAQPTCEVVVIEC